MPLQEKSAMAIIKTEDFISSIADSLQYISYYHPLDFVEAMYKAPTLRKKIRRQKTPSAKS